MQHLALLALVGAFAATHVAAQTTAAPTPAPGLSAGTVGGAVAAAVVGGIVLIVVLIIVARSRGWCCFTAPKADDEELATAPTSVGSKRAKSPRGKKAASATTNNMHHDAACSAIPGCM